MYIKKITRLIQSVFLLVLVNISSTGEPYVILSVS
jgi:hypothetical protein